MYIGTYTRVYDVTLGAETYIWRIVCFFYFCFAIIVFVIRLGSKIYRFLYLELVVGHSYFIRMGLSRARFYIASSSANDYN